MKKLSFVKIKKSHAKSAFAPDPAMLLEINNEDEEESSDSEVEELIITTNIPTNEKHTDLSKIFNLEPKTFMSFYDRIKNLKKWIITMIDVNSGRMLLDETNVECFWCRSQFKSSPIGCPIKVIDNEYIEKYIYTQTNYTYLKGISISSSEIEQYKNDKYSFYGSMKEKKSSIKYKSSIMKSNKFLTDGIFCSFNCTQAFIDDNIDNYMYKLSSTLLANMYKYYTGKYHYEKIPAAPHWRLLKKCGGKLDCNEFRKSFLSVKYSEVNNIYIPVGHIWSEEVVF